MIYEGLDLLVRRRERCAVLGVNGAGKSTLLRIIAGVDQPTKGKVTRDCSISWPMGFGGGLLGSLTGRQNCKFVCRIHGHERDIPERLDARCRRAASCRCLRSWRRRKCRRPRSPRAP